MCWEGRGGVRLMKFRHSTYIFSVSTNEELEGYIVGEGADEYNLKNFQAS